VEVSDIVENKNYGNRIPLSVNTTDSGILLP